MTRRARSAATLTRLLASIAGPALLVAGGCANGGGGTGAGAGAGARDATTSMNESAAGGARPARGGAAPPAGGYGSLTPEELAAQGAASVEEFQRLMAAKERGAAGPVNPNGSPVPPRDTMRPGTESALKPLGAPEGTAARPPATPAAAGSGGGGSGAATAPLANAPRGGDAGAEGAGPAMSAASERGGRTPGRATPPPTNEALTQAAAALYRDATGADAPLQPLMALAALSIAEPERPFDAEALPGLTDEERAALTRFHAFCRDLGRGLAKDQDPRALTTASERLAQELRGEQGLRVPRAEFCTRVAGFGDYDAVADRTFLAHAGARVALYFEVEGYDSQERPGDGWRTDLSVELSILSERDGIPVWRQEWQSVSDKAASRRQDFFVTQIVKMPESLGVGAYVMKVRVRDEHRKALAEKTLPFRMVAELQGGTPPAAAGTRGGTR
ncbi:MAG: hypothetical protein U0574_00550 [Phycisphaerales bacterium]